jgi:hypothetical protein
MHTPAATPSHKQHTAWRVHPAPRIYHTLHLPRARFSESGRLALGCDFADGVMEQKSKRLARLLRWLRRRSGVHSALALQSAPTGLSPLE